MNPTAALLAPLLLLISAVSGDEEQGEAVSEPSVQVYPEQSIPAAASEWPTGAVRSFVPDSAWQVHIEQRMTIRVAPRANVPMPRDPLAGVPKRPQRQRISERKMGKCLPIAGIAGVEPNGPDSLILFMRDRRLVTAQLERSCPSRAFYSGFYLSRSIDGMVCVDRDTLLSRSGSACKLSRIRQLVDDDD
ncbi:hypothetical protein [Novosphingobium sp. 9U]|uniref:hypothetical protein n=1 Tax=Novosphingobium sp. 9U TaxID=2653158 RepID=UPI0012F1BA89|nr:hypothetical protein [Novosphingobium sp. 9U]VWX51842.1 conserved exported hypothetical protein [Novosphingobium sp. 9U]